MMTTRARISPYAGPGNYRSDLISGKVFRRSADPGRVVWCATRNGLHFVWEDFDFTATVIHDDVAGAVDTSKDGGGASSKPHSDQSGLRSEIRYASVTLIPRGMGRNLPLAIEARLKFHADFRQLIRMSQHSIPGSAASAGVIRSFRVNLLSGFLRGHTESEHRRDSLLRPCGYSRE